MNDFDYENLQKKRLARNAFAKKGGSRSKKCTLPGDYLTPAQKAKLSTTLVTVNLRKPMGWSEFKALPTNLKREYLEYLRDEHGALRAWVAVDLFGITNSGYQHYIDEHEPTLAGVFPRTGRYRPERREKWLAFVEGREEPQPEAEVETELEPAPVEIVLPEPEEHGPVGDAHPEPVHELTVHTQITSGQFTVKGFADEALQTLMNLFKDDHHRGTYTLSFSYEGG